MQDLWQDWSYFKRLSGAMLVSDDASIASDGESVIILTQVHTYPVGANSDCVLAQDVPGSVINSNLVLLDSQSTVDLFTNLALIQNIRSVCPESKPPAQIHAVSAVDDASVASDKESVIILTQVHTYPVGTNLDYELAQDVPGSAINSDFNLLDSQLTVDLFANPAHIQNICPTKNPIQVHCNRGTMSTATEANFVDTPVFFNSRGIANVLFLYRLGCKFQVTYDSSDCNGVFQVHTKKDIIEFKPTPKGLHALNLKDNPKAAFLLVNDADIQMTHIDHNQMHVTQAS